MSRGKASGIILTNNDASIVWEWLGVMTASMTSRLGLA